MKKKFSVSVFFSLVCFFLIHVIYAQAKPLKNKPRVSVVPVLGDDVNLREEPSVNSKVVFSLKMATLVEVLEVKPGVIRIGKLSGHWARVKVKLRSNLTGWVFDHYLGYPEKFKGARFHKKLSVTCGVGDYWVTYVVDKNSHFQYHYSPCLGGNCTAKGKPKTCNLEKEKLKDGVCYGQGDVLRAGKVVWFMRRGTSDMADNFYYLCKKHFFCSPQFMLTCSVEEKK